MQPDHNLLNRSLRFSAQAIAAVLDLNADLLPVGLITSHCDPRSLIDLRAEPDNQTLYLTAQQNSFLDSLSSACVALNEDTALQLMEALHGWLIRKQQAAQAAALESSNG